MYRHLKTTSSILMKHLSKKRMHLLLSRHSLFLDKQPPSGLTSPWCSTNLCLICNVLAPTTVQKGSSASEKNKHLSILPESSGRVNLRFYNLENMSSVLKTLMRICGNLSKPRIANATDWLVLKPASWWTQESADSTSLTNLASHWRIDCEWLRWSIVTG